MFFRNVVTFIGYTMQKPKIRPLFHFEPLCKPKYLYLTLITPNRIAAIKHRLCEAETVKENALS